MITLLLALRDSLPLWEQQFAPRLSKSGTPHSFWGEQDRLFPPQVGRDLQALIHRLPLHPDPERRSHPSVGATARKPAYHRIPPTLDRVRNRP